MGSRICLFDAKIILLKHLLNILCFLFTQNIFWHGFCQYYTGRLAEWFIAVD